MLDCERFFHRDYGEAEDNDITDVQLVDHHIVRFCTEESRIFSMTSRLPAKQICQLVKDDSLVVYLVLVYSVLDDKG